MIGQAYRKELARLLLDESVEAEISPILMDGARMNDKRPAWMKFAVPDEWTKNASGFEALVDGYLAMRIPREAVMINDEETVYNESKPLESVSENVNEVNEVTKES